MLKILRRKGVYRKVLWGIAIIIIISFALGASMTNMAAGPNPLSGSAGKAFGKTISMKEFRKAALDTRDQALLMYGEKAATVLSSMNLDSETWTRILLLQEVKNRAIKTGNNEVVNYVLNIPFFQQDGVFNQQLYESIMKNVFRRPSHEFEEGIRGQISIMKLFNAETRALTVPNEVVRQEYEKRNQKIRLNTISINPADLAAGITISDDELKPYFDAHPGDFLEPDSVNLHTASFPLKEGISAEEKDLLLAKANDVKQLIDKGTALAAAAKDAQANFTESGFFNAETIDHTSGWPLDVYRQIFEASALDVIGPIETADSIQVIQIAEIKPSFIPPFDKLREKIRTKILDERTFLQASQNAEKIREQLAAAILSGKTFAAAAAELSLNVKQTPFIAMGEYIPEIGLSENIQSAAFALTDSVSISDVVPTTNGPVILNRDAVQPADEKKFEDVKNDFANTLLEEQKVAAMNRLIASIKEKAQIENFLDQVKKPATR